MRRDLADLNRRYLELGLRPDTGSDPLLAWSDDVRREIRAAEPAIRDRMASCPFALFKIHLPAGNPVPGTEFHGSDLDGARVEDRPQDAGPGDARPGACIAFTHGALFSAWRLADSAPLVARIAFGLAPATELELNDMCPTRLAMLATHPGVVRARWPDQPRFWVLLRDAAHAESWHQLQWAHCFGICLMDGEHGGARAEDVETPQGQPRR
jgi:hypothetical protein